MSKLRINKWKCQNWLGVDKDKKDLGLCGDTATYRCNACKRYFCSECWIDHLEMTVRFEGCYMSWRPKEGWNNPHTDGIGRARVYGEKYRIFEAGADAMLGAICRNAYVTSEALRNVPSAPGWKDLKDGKWYFIPD